MRNDEWYLPPFLRCANAKLASRNIQEANISGAWSIALCQLCRISESVMCALCMADILTLHQENNHLCDIGCMIADALESLCDED